MKLRESSSNGGEIESRDRGREEIEEGEREGFGSNFACLSRELTTLHLASFHSIPVDN